jgi:uncharacterized glyoxalase superfamily protein PhnB
MTGGKTNVLIAAAISAAKKGNSVVLYVHDPKDVEREFPDAVAAGVKFLPKEKVYVR